MSVSAESERCLGGLGYEVSPVAVAVAVVAAVVPVREVVEELEDELVVAGADVRAGAEAAAVDVAFKLDERYWGCWCGYRFR
jgi:hypothetical protein